MIIEINKDNPIVLDDNPVLLDFWAPWCGPCKMTSKNLEKFSEEHFGIKIYKINVDENEELVEEYLVHSLPTLIYLDKNGELWRHNGLMTVKMLEDKLF